MPIFTGDEIHKNTNRNNGVPRETGIIGSLRWWYEALTRGLGGTACDPSRSECDEEKHCGACELFGCTGWSRKFKLIINRVNKSHLIFRFIELRSVEDVEWSLLNLTLNIIAEYGIIGGKMSRLNKKRGLIKIIENELKDYGFDEYKVKKYILAKKGKSNSYKGDTFPDISKFIFVKNDYNKFNIKDLKNNCVFLKGEKGSSKKYFYKKDNNKIYHFFAYAEKDKDFNQLKKYLEKNKIRFLNMEGVIKELNTNGLLFESTRD